MINLNKIKFQRINNVDEICIKLCEALKIKITDTTIKNELLGHPFYPSFLCISDIMEQIGITVSSLKINNIEDLKDVKVPILTQIKDRKTGLYYFSIIYSIKNNGTLKWYNPIKHCKEIISFERFYTVFTGYVQIYEKTNSYKEDMYIYKTVCEYAKWIIKNIFEIILFLLIVLVSASIFDNTAKTYIKITYLILFYIGFYVCKSIINLKNGYKDFISNRVCTKSENSDCDDITNHSPKLFFGINIEILGTSYMLGQIFLLSILGLKEVSTLSLSCIVGLSAIPVLLVSIYYQMFIYKRFCPLCITVSIITSISCFISLYAGWYKYYELITINGIVSFCLLFFVFTKLLSDIGDEQKEKDIYKMENKTIKNIKYDVDVFNTLLIKNRKIKEPDLGVVIGNKFAELNIFTICSPFCKHCSNAHKEFNKLIEMGKDVRIHILFLVTPDTNSKTNKLVKEILFIKHNEHKLKEVLNNWFLNEEKDIEVI